MGIMQQRPWPPFRRAERFHEHDRPWLRRPPAIAALFRQRSAKISAILFPGRRARRLIVLRGVWNAVVPPIRVADYPVTVSPRPSTRCRSIQGASFLNLPRLFACWIGTVTSAAPPVMAAIKAEAMKVVPLHSEAIG